MRRNLARLKFNSNSMHMSVTLIGDFYLKSV